MKIVLINPLAVNMKTENIKKIVWVNYISNLTLEMYAKNKDTDKHIQLADHLRKIP